MKIDDFNALPESKARHALFACCSSPAWSRRLAAARPYSSDAELFAAAERVLAELSEAEIDHALDGHPRIGERRDADRVSAREQAAVTVAGNDVKRAIAEGNRDYEARFGQVYLVAASGRSPEELLADLRHRLDNDPATERKVLRSELAKINRIRLGQLIEGEK